MSFTYLSYAPRSGSTKLAGLLDAARGDLLVLPELRTPLWLIEAERSEPLTNDTVRSILRRDPQASDLGFDPDQIVDNVDGGLTTPAVLRSIVQSYAADLGVSPAEHVVVKHGRSAERFTDIRQVDPDARLLHLVRDPRGVANSMERSLVPRDPGGANFARNNPLYPARLWRERHVSYLAAKQSHPEAAQMVLFPELGDPTRIDEIASWITGATEDVSGRVEHGDLIGISARPIPTAEHSIHGLASESFRAGRDDAWRTELSPTIAGHIETLLWDHMDSLSMTGRDRPSRSEKAKAEAADLIRRPREIATRVRTIARGRFVSAGPT